MDELRFQSELVDSARVMGGYGRKLAHKFQVGIPDLMLMLPGKPVWFVEAKWWPKPPQQGKILKVATTKKQRYELGLIFKSNADVKPFVMVGWSDGKYCHATALSYDTEEVVGVPPLVITKQKGNLWPLDLILQA